MPLVCRINIYQPKTGENEKRICILIVSTRIEPISILCYTLVEIKWKFVLLTTALKQSEH